MRFKRVENARELERQMKGMETNRVNKDHQHKEAAAIEKLVERETKVKERDSKAYDIG